jgi:invasion protein IalB
VLLSWFLLCSGNQTKHNKTCERARLEANQAKEDQDMRPMSVVLLLTHQDNSDVGLLLLIKVNQDSFITLTDGQSHA